MSAPPPPSFGQPGGTPPPPPWANQSLQPGQGPGPRSGSSNTPKIIAGLVAVAVLAGGGVFLATRNSDGKKAVTVKTTPDTTNSSDTTEPDTAAATTVAPTTTALAPTTTIAVTTTVATAAPTTTVPFTLPAGAVDLGGQVFIVPPAGWTNTPDAATGANVLSDGVQKAAIEVIQRPVGEDPKALGQEYLDSFDLAPKTVSVSQSTSYTIDGAMPASVYIVKYRIFDAAADSGTSLEGGLALFQRGDGLSVVYDLYGPPVNSMGFTSDAFSTLEKSYEAAPAIGPVSTQTLAPSFRLKPRSAPIFVDANLAFTPAPGFVQSAGDGNGFATASLSDDDFVVVKFAGQASLDAALQTAEAALNASFSNITFDTVDPGPPVGSVTREGLNWKGTYTANGNAVLGGLDVFFDSATGNAVSIVTDFYVTADGRDPNPAEIGFMFNSMRESVQINGIQ